MRRLLKLLIGAVVLVVGLLIAAGFAAVSGDHEYAEMTDEQTAIASAYLAEALTPLPEGAVFGTFEREPGVTLETLIVPHPEPRATIVLAPGYTAPLEVYGGTFQAFYDAGYAVVGLSQRGQGRSWRPLPNPEKGYVEDYRDLSADLAAFIGTIDGPVMVYGNSMGGHISMLMAGTEDVDVAAYALLVPMAKIDTGAFPYGVAKALTGFYSTIGFGANYGFGYADWTFASRDASQPTNCSANPARAHTRHMLVGLNPELRVSDVTNRYVWETMKSTAEAAAPDHLVRITAPVLSITAGDDRIVQSEAAEANCKAMPGCTLLKFDGARHCIMHESERQKADVHAAVIGFFDNVSVK